MRLAPKDADVGRPATPDHMQVVARAIEVMRCFEGAHIALGNREIAARTGLPKSTVSRLTHTLTRIGQLTYVPRDQKYRPGDAAIAHASSLLHGLEHRQLIHGWMEDCARRIHGTWGMTMRDRFDMVFLDYARSAGALALNATIGTRVPLALAACGRAWVVAQPLAAQGALLTDLARHDAGQAAALREWLEANRADFERTGYVLSCGDLSRHVNGIGVAVYSRPHGTTIVFGLGALAAEHSEERLRREAAPLLLSLARQVAVLQCDLRTEPSHSSVP